MIRKTLADTRSSTFSINLPNKQCGGFPTPSGTGFLVSPSGLLLTAAHVVEERNEKGTPSGQPRGDLSEGWIEQSPQRVADPNDLAGILSPRGVDLELLEFNKATDVALLRVGKFGGGRINTPWPHLRVSSRTLEEGEPVYSFGYPLSESWVEDQSEAGGIVAAGSLLCPRVTSAIVSSALERSGPTLPSGGPPHRYVLDKALNYGNSGGPIVATETGHVHALCSRFQPVRVPQPRHPANLQFVTIPSLYGITVNLTAEQVRGTLSKLGVELVDD